MTKNGLKTKLIEEMGRSLYCDKKIYIHTQKTKSEAVKKACEIADNVSNIIKLTNIKKIIVLIYCEVDNDFLECEIQLSLYYGENERVVVKKYISYFKKDFHIIEA